MREIVQEGAQILREVAVPVAQGEFGGAELQKLVTQMTTALNQEPDGVALAAPQLGVGKRVFIVRMDRVEPPPLPGGDTPKTERPAIIDVYVNPEIVKASRRRQKADEGCLSVRGMYGAVSRHERVKLRAHATNGTTFTRGASGLLAQIFEHEVDHLNGTLFIDTAEDLVEIKPHESHDSSFSARASPGKQHA